MFIEAPQTKSEMTEICRSLPGPKMAITVAGGLTPELPIEPLQAIGYSLAAYLLTLLATAMKVTIVSLHAMRRQSTMDLMDFGELRERVGFNDYYEISAQYSSSKRESG